MNSGSALCLPRVGPLLVETALGLASYVLQGSLQPHNSLAPSFSLSHSIQIFFHTPKSDRVVSFNMASGELTPDQIAYQMAHAHETKQPMIYGVCALYVVVDSIIVGLRLYARRISKVRLASDDYFIIAALVSNR